MMHPILLQAFSPHKQKRSRVCTLICRLSVGKKDPVVQGRNNRGLEHFISAR